ncbi:Acyltransferase [Rhodovastum atsumiense]|nr:acyltransferase [Rhodovastum atsumiense]CAH2602182.1 Acyltransferase [Rhodovastum atsumiense]
MTQHRYAYLDGIRGLAAIFVLTRHIPFLNFNFYRSYLAVDLFFILSGFVLAHAYDRKLREGMMSARRFMLIRAIRLYPVFLLSALLSIVAAFAGAFSKHLDSFSHLADLSFAALATIMLLPWPASGNPSLFPINGVYWSLFFEVLANFLYARCRFLLTGAVLAGVAFLAATGIVVLACCHGNLDAGFLWTWQDAGAGMLRSIFGISMGLLLYRQAPSLSRCFGRVSPWLIFPIVGIILASPASPHLNWLIDVICVCLIFPACVLIGARRPTSTGETILLALGSASYPIYVLHVPIAKMMSPVWESVDAFAPYGGILFIVLLVMLSVGLERIYDVPVRRYLLGRLRKSRPADAAQGGFLTPAGG